MLIRKNIAMDTKNIPNCLRLYRKRCGLKQQEVALKLGVKNASMISRWEKGLSIPKFDNILDLALIYSTSTDALYIDYRQERKEVMQIRTEALNISN